MLVLLLACAPTPLVTDRSAGLDTSTDPGTDTDTGTAIGACARWAGEWAVDPQCDGAVVGIPGTGTASMSEDCVLDASVAFIGSDGACRIIETIRLAGTDPDPYAGQTTDVATNPDGCAPVPEIVPFDLGDVTFEASPNAVTVSFTQPPWLLRDCAGVAELVLTPSTGT
jgi:hypothetical protein